VGESATFGMLFGEQPVNHEPVNLSPNNESV
jgi:hypothetical protein